MPFIAARFSAQVDDSAGELAPVWPEIIVLHLEFRYRILRRKNERQINIADVEWLAVQILRALVCKGTAHLKISEVEWVLADGRAVGVSLRNYGGSHVGEIENVATIQGQLVYFAFFHNLT